MSKAMYGLILFFILSTGYLLVWHAKERKELEQWYIRDQIANIVNSKRAEVESVFTSIYQNIRTITLLPSIKSITGKNRTSDDQDVVKEGLFSQDGRETIQQIYNNLASRTNVSEVYVVIDGLNSSKGEIPFLMFDTLVFGEKDTKPKEQKTDDTPEEREDEEYNYFPRQISAIKASYPKFTFTNIDEIPTFLSTVMRTCDNSQYHSKTKGNVRDADGFLYSVPFYDNGGDVGGVVSAILRTNVFEALLIGIPFIPITDTDIAEQQRDHWDVPEPARFVLSNKAYNVHISDRRNQPKLPPMTTIRILPRGNGLM